MGNKKRATFLATMLQNELNSYMLRVSGITTFLLEIPIMKADVLVLVFCQFSNRTYLFMIVAPGKKIACVLVKKYVENWSCTSLKISLFTLSIIDCRKCRVQRTIYQATVAFYLEIISKSLKLLCMSKKGILLRELTLKGGTRGRKQVSN